MRTTLDLDDDVLRASRELARAQRTTAGKVISDLVRKALGAEAAASTNAPTFLGFRPFASRGPIVTNDAIDHLREDGE
jgi:hypothetical protein